MNKIYFSCQDITFEDKISFRESLEFIPRVSIWWASGIFWILGKKNNDEFLSQMKG